MKQPFKALMLIKFILYLELLISANFSDQIFSILMAKKVY